MLSYNQVKNKYDLVNSTNRMGLKGGEGMRTASLVLAVLSVILGVVTAIQNLQNLREDRLWLESSRGSNRSEDDMSTEDLDSTFPSA